MTSHMLDAPRGGSAPKGRVSASPLSDADGVPRRLGPVRTNGTGLRQAVEAVEAGEQRQVTEGHADRLVTGLHGGSIGSRSDGEHGRNNGGSDESLHFISP